MLNMLKVHEGSRVAQRTGNRIGSLNAGSPGSVIAGTESHYQATAVQLCPGISYPQRKPHHKNISAQLVMSNNLPKDYERWGDASPTG